MNWGVAKMNESYYEILIKNISDVDFVENDREVFF